MDLGEPARFDIPSWGDIKYDTKAYELNNETWIPYSKKGQTCLWTIYINISDLSSMAARA